MNWLEKTWNQICDFFREYVATPFSRIGATDVIDILLLAVILYTLYRFFRNRRAGRVMVGLLAVTVMSILVCIFRLPALSYIVRLFAGAAFFCIVVIFQPELRDALERIGNATFLNPRSDTLPRKQYGQALSVSEEVVEAAFRLSETKTGALIIFEGMTKLGDYMKSGKLVDARVTAPLLCNIFYDKAPLHDGALIIRNMRIYMASCVLPSTKGTLNFGSMGTRHRAAVGVTEVSDALALIVSEETGIVSVAQDGKLLRDVDRDTLKDILMTYLAGNLYLRIKRGVCSDPFENLPKLNRNTEPEPETQNSAPKETKEIPSTAKEPPAGDADADVTEQQNPGQTE